MISSGIQSISSIPSFSELCKMEALRLGKVSASSFVGEPDRLIRNAEESYARVRKWTKSVDIFQKEFLVIPINEQ